MASPPWEKVPSHEQYFVLVTGANSGVGLGICQRLIDEFLETRPLSAHLVLIPTTRTASKSRKTIQNVRSYLNKTVQTSKTLRAKVRSNKGNTYNLQGFVDRVHLLSIEVDLCKLRSIYGAAAQLVHGKICDPTGVSCGGKDVSIPRIDAVLLNAGYGGWSGLSWFSMIEQFLTVGPIQATTFPWFKVALPTNTLPPQEIAGGQSPAEGQPELGEVFCANVFGHYLLTRELMPLLSRNDGPPSRVVWTSSIDAEEKHLDFNDFQAMRSKGPYESSKRITDLMCLGSNMSSVAKVSSSYSSASKKPVQPRFYLTHPGIVCTPLFPISMALFYLYYGVMYAVRWLGSAWHPVDPYSAACAMVWVALADHEALDGQNAENVKWGSSCDRWGNTAPKKTEVYGWGWEGKVEDAEALKKDEAVGVLRKMQGRKWNAVDLTKDKLIRFESDAAKCWAELERLRRQWEVILKAPRCENGGL